MAAAQAPIPASQLHRIERDLELGRLPADALAGAPGHRALDRRAARDGNIRDLHILHRLARRGNAARAVAHDLPHGGGDQRGVAVQARPDPGPGGKLDHRDPDLVRGIVGIGLGQLDDPVAQVVGVQMPGLLGGDQV